MNINGQLIIFTLYFGGKLYDRKTSIRKRKVPCQLASAYAGMQCGEQMADIRARSGKE